jgi:hypothetical protein
MVCSVVVSGFGYWPKGNQSFPHSWIGSRLFQLERVPQVQAAEQLSRMDLIVAHVPLCLP